MDIKEEVKNVVKVEVKSTYYKGRVAAALLEKGYKISKKQAKFLAMYIKELKKK